MMEDIVAIKEYIDMGGWGGGGVISSNEHPSLHSSGGIETM